MTYKGRWPLTDQFSIAFGISKVFTVIDRWLFNEGDDKQVCLCDKTVEK